ncbi:MAG: isoamylase early set domain-containing protein [Kiritimatiellae bacterium]|nr:isoamylase early set domain-containing protein [Kiritimatiellia bacterium]
MANKGKTTKRRTARTAAAEAGTTVKGPARKRVTFSVSAEPGSKVAVSGDFNNWDTTGHPMVDRNGDGNYTASILLAPGSYEYKFIVNDTWSIDPNCPEWVQNSFGTLNSVVHVQ